MKNGGPRVWEAMHGLVDGVAQALDNVEMQLPRGFPERIWDPISNGMRSQAKKFLSEAATLS
jgi:serine/threonine-protein kinase HipA